MNRFWDWAVAAYGADGVAEACLELQDAHGQCVPLLLWAAWQQHQGREITIDEAARAVAMARSWSEEVIAPLRQVRRRLKQDVAGDNPQTREPLRDSVKAAELAAERALMERLTTLTIEGKGTGENLSRVASAWSGKTPAQALDRLTEALTKGEVLQYTAS